MTVFAGIDLAWSGRKPTGVCVLRETARAVSLERLECIENAGALDVAALLDDLGSDVTAGIDAPLIVGADRRAEAQLACVFGSRRVHAYAARQDFLERHGITEGPKLGRLLEGAGWNLDPMKLTSEGRHALEVFPHATIVSLLGAARALRYKKGALGARIGPFSEFQARLRAYAEIHLPCLLSEPSELLTKPIERTTGRLMKDLEDRMDAMTCAIAAFHAGRFGIEGLSLFGDVHNGYIAVPKLTGTATSVLAPSSP